jgi:GT2 family glycosyltransferase
MSRVLCHIHTFNDEDVVEACLGAALSQTRPPDELVVIDNCSSDATLAKVAEVLAGHSSVRAKVITNESNGGTSTAVAQGLRYALEGGYDWCWILDADSHARKDTLEKQLDFFESLSAEDQREVWLLGSYMEDPLGTLKHPGGHLTRRGIVPAEPDPEKTYYGCDIFIWSGSLYKLSAVKEVGLPQIDYVLDWGEMEYGYRGTQAGYRALVNEETRIDHNIGAEPFEHSTPYQLGPLRFRLLEFSVPRCYYFVRNLLYFTLYEFRPLNVSTLWSCLKRTIWFTFNFALRPITRSREVRACLVGFWDGLRGNLGRRYLD